MRNIFKRTDSMGETLTLDEFELKSGRKQFMVRIFNEDEKLQGGVELKGDDLMGLRMAIDTYMNGDQ